MGTIEVGREARVVVTTALMGALAKGAQAVADLGEEARRATAGMVDLDRLADLVASFESAGKAVDQAIREVEAVTDGLDEEEDGQDEVGDPREVRIVGERGSGDAHCGAVTNVGGPFGLVAWYAGSGGPGGWVVEAVTRRGDAGSAMYWITAPDSWKPIDLDGQPWVVVRFKEEAAIGVDSGQVLLPAATRGMELLDAIVEVLEGSDEDTVARARTELGLEARAEGGSSSSPGGSV